MAHVMCFCFHSTLKTNCLTNRYLTSVIGTNVLNSRIRIRKLKACWVFKHLLPQKGVDPLISS